MALAGVHRHRTAGGGEKEEHTIAAFGLLPLVDASGSGSLRGHLLNTPHMGSGILRED